MRNDIYRWYLASISTGQTGMKATIIYPATDTHIRKSEKQHRRMMRETPEIYKNVVEKYIETMKGSRIQWFCSRFRHWHQALQYPRSQSRRRADYIWGYWSWDWFLTPSWSVWRLFSRLTSSKWDVKTLSALYLVAIPRRRDISSIRDLNSSHIPLLKQFRTAIIEATIANWPEISTDQLRLYFHCISHNLYLAYSRPPVILSSPYPHSSHWLSPRGWHCSWKSLALRWSNWTTPSSWSRRIQTENNDSYNRRRDWPMEASL